MYVKNTLFVCALLVADAIDAERAGNSVNDDGLKALGQSLAPGPQLAQLNVQCEGTGQLSLFFLFPPQLSLFPLSFSLSLSLSLCVLTRRSWVLETAC